MSSSDPTPDEAVWRAFTQDVAPLSDKRIVQSPPLTRAPIVRVVTHTLDLHGMTTADAHSALLDFIHASSAHFKYATVITGISGSIRTEFTHWLDHHPRVRRLEELPGGGAFRVYFRF